MNYNYQAKKIIAVVKENLEPGIALNIVGHLAVSIGHNASDHMGRATLKDASGINHLGISKYPFIVTKANGSKIRAAIETARADGRILFADYPQQMLDTGHDDELASSLNSAPESELKYLGAIFFAETELLKPITGKFSLYK